MKQLSLVYLCYIPFGKKFLESFLQSYTTKKAGIDHTLVILFNGHENEEEITLFKTILDRSGIDYDFLISPEKFDIASYFFAAKELKSEFIAFVNTYSEILHDDWLLYLYQNLVKKDIGCVSATGSWGDFRQNDEYKELVGKMKRLRISMVDLKKDYFFQV